MISTMEVATVANQKAKIVDKKADTPPVRDPKPWEAGWVHPLMSAKLARPEGIQTLHSWFTAWEAAQSPDEQLQLLHVGFDMPFKRYAQEAEYMILRLIRHYLTVADQYCEPHSLRKENEHDIPMFDRSPPQSAAFKARAQVAKKAFEILATHYFKPDKDEDRFSSSAPWRFRILDDAKDHFETLRHVLWFFERNMNNEWKSSEERVSHANQLAQAFVIGVISYFWDYKPARAHEHPLTIVQANTLRPQMVIILAMMGKAELLVEQPERFPLDRGVLHALHRGVMRKELWLPDLKKPSTRTHRRPRNLMEARLGAQNIASTANVLQFLLDRARAEKERAREIDLIKVATAAQKELAKLRK